MSKQVFDIYASEYDSWFMENNNVFESEFQLVAHCLRQAGKILSVGCGSGLFERQLAERCDIHVTRGIEPAEGMAAIARKRGLTVETATAEQADYGIESYDTVLFNGCPCYMQDLATAFSKAYHALLPKGKVIVIDVPKESAYGLLYNLALATGSWHHPLLEGCCPVSPYPIEMVQSAHWRTTDEITQTLTASGFTHLSHVQTLTLAPRYTHTIIESPTEGCERGSYVATIGYKEELAH